MTTRTSYNYLNVGETARLYLEIPDLLDTSGNKVHLSEIRKINIEKLNTSPLYGSDANLIVHDFYGIRNVKISVESIDINFFYFYSPILGKLVDLYNCYVKIIDPSPIAGYYEIEDILTDGYDSNNYPLSHTLYISGVFTTIPNDGITFILVDQDYNPIIPISNKIYASMFFNETVDSFNPVWKDNLYYLQDLNGNNFSYSSIGHDISDCTVKIYVGTDYTTYQCSRLLNTDAFYVVGFSPDSEWSSQQVYYWKLYYNNVEIPFALKQANILYQYFTPVSFETYTNSDNTSLYRYYIDWVIDDTPSGTDGTYLVSWFVKRTDKPEEVYQAAYIVHDDYIYTDTFNKKFNRENYYQLLQKYIPFFYIDYEADDVLKQTLQAFGQSIYDVQLKADNFLNIIDPQKTPVECLPYLSNLFSYRLKGNDIPSWRQQLEHIPTLLKKKGTLEGLTQVLDYMNVDVNSIVFYWQVKSQYLWIDYYSLNNNGNNTETFRLATNPIFQITGNYYDVYKKDISGIPIIPEEPFGLDFSRYQVDYYSTDQSKWYKLFPIYLTSGNTETLIYDLFNILGFNLIEDQGKVKVYSNIITWNINADPKNLYYITYRDTQGLFDSVFVSYINTHLNDVLKVEITAADYDVPIGTYYFYGKNVIIENVPGNSNWKDVRILLNYFSNENNIVPERIGSAPIRFSFDFEDNSTLNYQDLLGSLILSQDTVNSIKDENGKIGAENSDGIIEWFAPKPNDILKIRYQYKDYPYETNSSNSDYLINFDNSEICKDDFVLALSTADDREPYNENYDRGILIPKVNYNIKLVADNNYYSTQTNDFSCLDNYEISDLCSIKNPLTLPLVYGYIRTKFPWSENVYNMDEYDGSTRPSYEPCDIDEDFLDPCGCCWSSQFSMSVSILNMHDRMIENVMDTIREFKPFHSILKQLSYSGKFEDYIRGYDDDMYFEIRKEETDYYSIGYYPYDTATMQYFSPERSSLYCVNYGTFNAIASDLSNNIYLQDNEFNFSGYPIGLKETENNPSLPTLNINVSRVVITSTTGVHAGNTYNVSRIDKNTNKVFLTDGDTGDVLPPLPYTYLGPWNYTIYNRSYPATFAVDPSWPSTASGTVSKFGKYVINSSIDLLENEIEVSSTLTDPTRIYTVKIESGATIGIYAIQQITNTTIVLADEAYSFTDPYNVNIAFTVYLNGSPMDNYTSISGYFSREEVYGKLDTGSTDLVSEWDIKIDTGYICINNIYYKLVDNKYDSSLSKWFVIFKQYSTGAIGFLSYVIIQKLFNSTSGYIQAQSSKINSGGTINFNDFMNPPGGTRIEDFLIGLKINNKIRTYTIKSIDSDFVLDLNGLLLDGVFSSVQELYLLSFYLTKYSYSTYLNGGFPDSTIYPQDKEMQQLLQGTATGGGINTLVDSSIDFTTLHIKENDIVLYTDLTEWTVGANTDLSWAFVDSVAVNTITFTGPLSNGSSFSAGKLYRIIRRNIYDYNLDIPKADIIKIQISPTFNNMRVPINQVHQILAGTYDINIIPQVPEAAIEVDKDLNVNFEYVVAGPLNSTADNPLISQLSSYRLINVEPGEQFHFELTSRLPIANDSIQVSVNQHLWTRVETFTDPEERPEQYALKEYVVKTISKNNIQIWFGDGYTGKAIRPADVIETKYYNNGTLPVQGPAEAVNQNEQLFFEITDINTGISITVPIE